MALYQELKFESKPKQHLWVTVVNPTNQRLLLQACDNCGVVKSENSVIKRCRADQGLGLISGSPTYRPEQVHLARAV